MNRSALQHLLRSWRLTLVWAGLQGLSSDVRAWEPGSAFPDAIGSPEAPLRVDTTDRYDVISFYHCVFQASRDASAHMNWTGSLEACSPGGTSAAYKDDVRRRVNYFRAMAGVGADITFDDKLNRDAQAAALIMAENRGLSHNPLADYGETPCWSAEGERGANQGNLALGSHGPASIGGYMEDTGAHNAAVGHRRWILHHSAAVMGTGDVPRKGDFPYQGDEHPATNCLYVINAEAKRSALEAFVTWPPRGFVPATQVYERWSLQYSSPQFGAPRFGETTISMRLPASDVVIPVVVEHRYTGGAVTGDPAIVWIPDWSATGGRVPLDEPIEVTVSNITVDGSGATDTYIYEVTAIDPDVIPNTPVFEGPDRVSESGGNYHFTPLPNQRADAYEVGVATLRRENWTEGAEKMDAPIVDLTSVSYALRTAMDSMFGSPGARNGSHAFHLTIPSFTETNEMFEIDRTIIAGPDTKVSFYELFRWSSETSRLSAEIAIDGGPWMEAWGRNGNGVLSTEGWHKRWEKREIDLSPHAGRTVRVRFAYRASGAIFANTDAATGVYLDDIRVEAAEEVGDERLHSLPGEASTFTLSESTAGRELKDGDKYLLRIRPILGCRTFPFGPVTQLVIDASVQPPPEEGFAAWLDAHHPGLPLRAFSEDADGDTVPNGAEYALGMDPGRPDQPPGLTPTPEGWAVVFDPEALPYEVEGVNYHVQFSTDLEAWAPLPDADESTGLHFALPAEARGFARWEITRSDP